MKRLFLRFHRPRCRGHRLHSGRSGRPAAPGSSAATPSEAAPSEAAPSTEGSPEASASAS